MNKHKNDDLTYLVEAAKQNSRAADLLIGQYMPFIRAEAAKFLRRAASDSDDELSIAMIAFHEAILGYNDQRGGFLSYAAMLIQSRLIDYARKEKRHVGHISMDERDEDTPSIADTLADRSDHADETVMRAATKAEIQELSAQMQQFGISLSDVADNCPKQQRTLLACQKALTYARENSHLLDRLVNTGRLPVAELSAGAGVERKTLERHRKYMMALMLICTNGYEIIRGHIMQVLKGGTKS